MIHKIYAKKLEALFSEIYEKWPNCNLAMAYSDFDKELETNLSLESLLTKLLKMKHFLQLGFYVDEMKGPLIKDKIDLNPKACQGATFRYKLSGWGFVFLNISNKKTYFEVHNGVNSEKRAMVWFSTYPELKDPSLWEWKVVRATERDLNRIFAKHSE